MRVLWSLFGRAAVSLVGVTVVMRQHWGRLCLLLWVAGKPTKRTLSSCSAEELRCACEWHTECQS